MSTGEIELDLKIEWTIPDFFNYDEKLTRFRSPDLKYIGEIWHIELVKGIYDDWSLYIRKTYAGAYVFPQPCMYYFAGIKKIDGAVYMSERGKMESNIGLVFEGISVNRSVLLRDKMEIALHDAMVVFCSLSHKEERCGGLLRTAATQTGKSDHADACTDTLDEDFLKLRLQGNCSNVTLRSTPGIEKLGRNLKDLLLSGEDSDTVLIVGDTEFRAHKAILKSRSPALAAMFRHKMKELDSGSVNIIDCDPQAFEQFLLYVYTGEVDKLSADNVCQIYQVADKYDLPDLKSGCVEFMQKNLCMENFCDFISLALRYKELALIENATQYFVRNAKKIIITVKWLCFLKENPMEANELTIKTLNTVIED